MTEDEEGRFYARRREAGRVIDIATCAFVWDYAAIGDPYGIDPKCDTLVQELFVESADSGGWIHEGELPMDKRAALHYRIKIERALYDVACKTPGVRSNKESLVVERFVRMYPDKAREIEAAVREEHDRNQSGSTADPYSWAELRSRDEALKLLD
jgi:hypothetical protein